MASTRSGTRHTSEWAIQKSRGDLVVVWSRLVVPAEEFNKGWWVRVEFGGRQREDLEMVGQWRVSLECEESRCRAIFLAWLLPVGVLLFWNVISLSSRLVKDSFTVLLHPWVYLVSRGKNSSSAGEVVPLANRSEKWSSSVVLSTAWPASLSGRAGFLNDLASALPTQP